MVIRKCYLCGRKISKCDGIVKAGDFLKALHGLLQFKDVREKCGFCAERDLIEKYFHPAR